MAGSFISDIDAVMADVRIFIARHCGIESHLARRPQKATLGFSLGIDDSQSVMNNVRIFVILIMINVYVYFVFIVRHGRCAIS